MDHLLVEHVFPSGQRLQIVQGDLTQEKVDAIVNAANRHLQHGGGVAWAIVKRGGPRIQEESDDWVHNHGPVSHAEPAYTGGGSLPCRYVIHAVGPVWGEGDEDRKLEAAVTGSLRLAARLELTSIAFPAISTGIFGFPKERAAGVMYAAIQDYFDQNPQSGLKLVRLTLFDRPTIDAFLKVWQATGLSDLVDSPESQ
ncbi:MAG: macro domain-containing protein [Chloroflexota bacterium]|nr:MAG: macro domain-containing protein [Chloroflexota bacterium]